MFRVLAQRSTDQRDPSRFDSITLTALKGTRMQFHRLLMLLFAATLASATALAFTKAAHAEVITAAVNGHSLFPRP